MRRTQAQRAAILERIEREGWSLGEAAQKLGIPKGTLGSWRRRESERLQTGEGLQTGAMSGDGDSQVATHPDVFVPDSLTPQQAEACRLRVLGGHTQAEVGRLVGVARQTVNVWERLPGWSVYADDLRQDVHVSTVAAHRQAATMGASLRVRLLQQVEKILAHCERNQDADPAALLPVGVIKDMGNTLDRLTTSAEDRAGYPRIERVDIGQQPAGHDPTVDPREVLREELADLPPEVRLRIVGE